MEFVYKNIHLKIAQVSSTNSSQETPLYEENHEPNQECAVNYIDGSILNSGSSNNENSNNIDNSTK